MSDSVWPHTWQPTRFYHPWDSPGKNTGVGCHFLLQCMKVKEKSLSCVWLLVTPWTAAYQAPLSMGFSRQEYWSGVPEHIYYALWQVFVCWLSQYIMQYLKTRFVFIHLCFQIFAEIKDTWINEILQHWINWLLNQRSELICCILWLLE